MQMEAPKQPPQQGQFLQQGPTGPLGKRIMPPPQNIPPQFTYRVQNIN